MNKIEGNPTLCWPQFEIMNDDVSGSFEQMCRALFKNEFVQEGVALHSNHNNPGVEVDPVPARFHKGKKQFFISFQSKYYKNEVNYSDIKHSMKNAVKYYAGRLDCIYLFCNITISNDTKKLQPIVEVLQQANIDLKLITDKDIFDMYFNNQDVFRCFFLERVRGTYIADCCYDDTADYLKSYVDPLFMESQIGDGKTALLKDVYIPAEYKNGSRRESVESLLWQFFGEAFLPVRNIGVMIMGQPGSGKSSFVSYIANKLQEVMPTRTCYIIRLRNMKKSQINADDPIQGLLEYLRIEEDRLEDAILILDGLDEICALYQNTNFETYLNRLLQNCSTIKKLRLVITSRTGYFTVDNRISNYLRIVQIENWEDKDLDKWSKAYAMVHPSLQEIIAENKNHLKEEKYSDKKDIFAVPILFYMANARGELLSNHKSICSVYDAVLTEVTDERHYDPACYNATHDYISPQLARQICIEIAFGMFRCGRLNYIQGDPFLEPAEVELALSDAMETCKEDLSNLDANSKRRIKDTYALTFYYNKRNSKKNAVEFAHRTIAEYFTSEKIIQILCSASNSVDEEELCKILAECFGYAPVTTDVFRFLREKIKAKEKDYEVKRLKKALERHFLNLSINGKLFSVPEKYYSDMHCLDRIPVMLKSVLTLFEYLDCCPPSPNPQEKTMFNNLIASAARCEAVNAQHNSLMPFALNGFDLSDGHFTGCDFTEVHFSGTNLTHSDFTDASVLDGQFYHSIIDLADFSGANLAGVDFTIESAKGTDFTQATIQGADFSGSVFVDASFDETEMQDANLNECVFGKGCHFSNACLYGVQLDDADISMADISEAVFTDEDNEEDDEPEIMNVYHLTLTQEQYDFLTDMPNIRLDKPIIIQ